MRPPITCPVKHFDGTIVLPDCLNYEQIIAWEKSQVIADELIVTDEEGKRRLAPGVFVNELRAPKIPAILLIVCEWHLKNVPAKPTIATFPASPAKSAALLYDWLMEEISKLYAEEDLEIPNA